MRGKKNCNVGVITVKRGAFFAWRAQGANAGAERRSAWWFGTWALALMGGFHSVRRAPELRLAVWR